MPPGRPEPELRQVLTETVLKLRSQPGRRQLAEILGITYLSGPRSQQAAATGRRCLTPGGQVQILSSRLGQS
ncbi:hypothetical protein M877_04540 [Streptomyces niveus NCIMB 11891]|nr:hypothetical protein M877_04540 [Streptomyces niveus NCIMB 11891]